MELNNEQMRNRIETMKRLSKNIEEFKVLANEISGEVRHCNFHGVDVNLLDVVTKKYEFGDLIIDKGDIYLITERLPQSQYEHNIGTRSYVAKRLRWDLGLSEQEFDIEEELIYDSNNQYDFSDYYVSPRNTRG